MQCIYYIYVFYTKKCDRNFIKTVIICKPKRPMYVETIVFSQLFWSNKFLLSKKNTFGYYHVMSVLFNNFFFILCEYMQLKRVDLTDNGTRI